MASDDASGRFLRTIYKSKNIRRSLQALYNSELPPDKLQDVIDKSSALLPDLEGMKVDFSKYKKTKSARLHARALTDKHVKSLQTDAEVKANVGAYKRKLMGLGDLVGGLESLAGASLGAGMPDKEDNTLPMAPKEPEDPPKKKAKTRPVGQKTLPEKVLEASGLASAARLADLLR